MVAVDATGINRAQDAPSTQHTNEPLETPFWQEAFRPDALLVRLRLRQRVGEILQDLQTHLMRSVL